MAYGDYGKTTELEAVNICLSTIGEQPVNSIPESGVNKATMARDMLYEKSRELQEEGLACNKEVEVELSLNGDNQIVLPINCISVDPTYGDDNDFVERNGKLYDRENHTYTFTKNVYVDIVYFLQWTDLPEHVRRYITISTARIFQKRVLGNETIDKFSIEDEYKAKSQFIRKELNIEDMSLLDNLNVNPRVYRRHR